MGDDDTKHSSKHKRSRDSGERDKHKSRKHHKSHRDKDERSKRKDKKDSDGSRIVDDDAADDAVAAPREQGRGGERVVADDWGAASRAVRAPADVVAEGGGAA